MTTDLLTLSQWLSPAFPLGSFAYSHGLEAAIVGGDIRDADDLRAWLTVVISKGSGWNDAVLFCAARRGEDVCALARALASSKERLEETEAQGAAFCRTLGEMGVGTFHGPLPVALGTAARALDVTMEDAAALYLHSAVANLIQGAVRFMPLGQSEGQRVLQALGSLIRETAENATTADTSALGSGAFLSDMAAMAHETLEARLFKT